MNKIKVVFNIQPTKSYPEGGPQREEYWNGRAFAFACHKYAIEWCDKFECIGCRGNRDCPQHYPSTLEQMIKEMEELDRQS